MSVGEQPPTTELPQSFGSGEAIRRRIIAGVPSYNVESFVGEVVHGALEYVDEVVVVDDGSSDGTAEVARAAGAVVRSHEVNLGYGGAINSCFEAAREMDADVLVILDGDGQHDSHEVPQIVSPALNGEADVVIGSRFLDRNSDIPYYRRFGIHVITWLFNVGSKTKVTDSQSGYRAYGRKTIQLISLRERGMSASVEILIKARRKGLVFREVPISCRYHAGSSSMNPVKQGLAVAMKLVWMRLAGDGKSG